MKRDLKGFGFIIISGTVCMSFLVAMSLQAFDQADVVWQSSKWLPLSDQLSFGQRRDIQADTLEVSSMGLDIGVRVIALAGMAIICCGILPFIHRRFLAQSSGFASNRKLMLGFIIFWRINLYLYVLVVFAFGLFSVLLAKKLASLDEAGIRDIRDLVRLVDAERFWFAAAWNLMWVFFLVAAIYALVSQYLFVRDVRCVCALDCRTNDP